MTKTTKKRINRILFWVVVIIVFIYLVFPFYWAVNSSLKSENQLMMTPATWLPRDSAGNISITWDNYKAVFTNNTFVRSLLNSTIVAGTTTLVCLVIGSFAAFALGKLRFKGKKPVLYLVLSMTMFPQVTVLAGLYAVINALNLPPMLSMILSYMIFTLPFTVWVLTSFFKELPVELMQSAQVDGATPFQTFYHILLPLTAPALVTTGLLAFIAAWNEYLFALTFTTISPQSRTVPVAISLFTGQIARQEPFGEIMAGAVIVTIPIVILVLIFQRKIIAGLTAGAVKG
ncbi:MAG TPA: carbohydrate ABC transporter permease [Thermotogota bacterium]|nr:carbohydrate ABC transporter permease [Thermotogota bacterium]HPJ87547.1 carbohydrate ABC transporter permease [Thermotogota bacterium]HPR94752.1 carbohydrate ABC transporter permease [Thermotogota bacterium]